MFISTHFLDSRIIKSNLLCQNISLYKFKHFIIVFRLYLVFHRLGAKEIYEVGLQYPRKNIYIYFVFIFIPLFFRYFFIYFSGHVFHYIAKEDCSLYLLFLSLIHI